MGAATLGGEMTVEPPASHLHPADIAASLRARRGELLRALEGLSEASLFRPAPREGWTLRHLLSSLAAADAELVRVLDALRGAPGDGADDGGADDGGAVTLHLRRVRGEAMHVAHQLRLSALREHLHATTEQAALALEAAYTLPAARPVVTDRADAPSPYAYLSAYLSQTAEVLDAVRAAMERRVGG